VKTRPLSFKPFLPWRKVERPIDWPGQFGSSVPLDVEIGFGNGEFLVRRAQQRPERHFIGIELEWASVQRALQRIAQAQAANVRLLLADARVALQRLFEPLALQRVYSLFPCPWPKERHAKHRLFSHAFLTLLNSRLQPHGKVYVVTDHDPYLHWVLEQIPGSGFEGDWRVIAPHFRTKYERKWVAGGQQEFYELRLQKVAHHAVPLTKETDVQARRVEQFNPRQLKLCALQGPITVRCRDFLYDPERRKVMIAVLVAEADLTQEFWIEIACRGDHWTIRPARGCGVVPTPGVQRAVDLIWAAAAGQV
jgi:tRNA (guanine-N7-)-methyltransferase